MSTAADLSAPPINRPEGSFEAIGDDDDGNDGDDTDD
jgi:hypothetical protein